ARPLGYCLETAALDGMLFALVAVGGPARRVCAREHRRMLPRAVVVETRWASTSLPQNANPARGQRLMRSTGEVTFFHSDVAQHRFGEHDVLGLAAVRCTGQRKLVIAPAERVEST